MRDEDDIQRVADRAASRINRAVESRSRDENLEYLRGVRDALDWVIEEDMEDDPI